MDACILIRTNINYKQITQETFGHQGKTEPEAATIVAEAGLLSLWDKLFSIKFTDYRQKLKEISEPSVRTIGLPVFHGVDDGFFDWYATNDDGIIFPIDDDDLYAPNLMEVLSDFNDCDLVCWSPIHVNYSKQVRALYSNADLEKRLRTNNWAVKKSLLKNTQKSTKLEDLVVFENQLAWKRLVRDRRAQGCKTIKGHFSLHNRHFGCLSHLRGSVEKEQLRSVLTKIATQPMSFFKENQDIALAIPWAIPYIQSIERLIMSLRRPIFF